MTKCDRIVVQDRAKINNFLPVKSAFLSNLHAGHEFAEFAYTYVRMHL